MKNYKQLICGILIGAIAALSITALADFIVNPNPYPVKVNGHTVQIEGYNINDSTYFKLRDIAQAVGGFDVDFKDGAVVLQTPEATPTPAPTPAPVSNKNLDPLPDVPIKNIDGVDYVDKLDIEQMLKNIGLGNYDLAGNYFYSKDDRANPILENVPTKDDDVLLIPADYYISTLVPIINNLR